MRLVSQGSGNTYYVGPGGATQWTPPAGGAAAGQPPPPPGPPPPDSGGLPPGWTEQVDPGSGQKYYYNSATGATSWTHPSSKV